MLEGTKTVLIGVMGTDPSITTEMKSLVLKVLSDGPGSVHCGVVDPLVVSRSEAARLIGLTPKRVDDFTRSGKLKRVYMPGCSRATGILRSSIEDVIMSGSR